MIKIELTSKAAYPHRMSMVNFGQTQILNCHPFDKIFPYIENFMTTLPKNNVDISIFDFMDNWVRRWEIFKQEYKIPKVLDTLTLEIINSKNTKFCYKNICVEKMLFF